ncbi:MAG: roadblock/LC7 domain-containing protein [Anaerolineae bacterium]
MTYLNLPVEIFEDLETIVRTLQRKIQAEIVLLADVSGQLILEEGRGAGIEPSIVAALGAGQLTAMKELARQVGDPEPHGSFLHESGHKRIYLCNVAESFVLIVVFTEEVPVGLVRLFTERAVNDLEELVTDFESWIDDSGSLFQEEGDDDDEDFGAALAEAFDEAFEGF